LLAGLEEIQRSDFEGIFRAMRGLPVTIRLLDPPLHEFLPAEHFEAELGSLEKRGGAPEEIERLRRTVGLVRELREANPMLGTGEPGSRCSTRPSYEMQVRAIVEAAGRRRRCREAAALRGKLEWPSAASATFAIQRSAMMYETRGGSGDEASYPWTKQRFTRAPTHFRGPCAAPVAAAPARGFTLASSSALTGPSTGSPGAATRSRACCRDCPLSC
jgi:hypothetical protein